MIFATIPRHVVLPEFVISQVRQQKIDQAKYLNQYVNSQFRLQNIDLPNTTPERIEALIHLVSEEHDFEEQLKKSLREAEVQVSPFTLLNQGGQKVEYHREDDGPFGLLAIDLLDGDVALRWPGIFLASINS